ncbi:MAG: YiiX/YebB-like N1pC/P60 family cysteine hydrolase, partial [Bdellovibrionota bacterium]
PRWNHVALYVGDGVVIEAGGKIPENVHRVSLNEFLETHHVMIGRCKDSDPKKAIDFVVVRLGLPYNARFILTDVAYCCSELVAGALNAAATIPGEVIVRSQRRPFHSGLCVSPEDILRSPKIDWWYKSSPSYFWKAVWSVIRA